MAKKTGTIDFHTHAFPDKLADRAIGQLQAAGGITACLDGRISSLLRSMDEAGIARSVVCSVATRPAQFDAILEWSGEIASDRIIPFPSVHPADPDTRARVRRISRAGFKGLKIHPYYQDFFLDDETCNPLYETAEAENLVLVSHTGFDFAFPFIRRADPDRVLRVVKRFPGLKLVATHLGAWRDWAEVEKKLLGSGVFLEISFSLQYLAPEDARRMILNHPEERVLLGTDSPWTPQAETVKRLRDLNLGGAREAKILGANALHLLGLT